MVVLAVNFQGFFHVQLGPLFSSQQASDAEEAGELLLLESGSSDSGLDSIYQKHGWSFLSSAAAHKNRDGS